jgi:hypothetical protein
VYIKHFIKFGAQVNELGSLAEGVYFVIFPGNILHVAFAISQRFSGPKAIWYQCTALPGQE